MLRPGFFILLEWIAFGASWVLAAGWSSAADKRLGMRRELPYRIVLIVGALVEGVPAHGYEGPLRLWWVTREEAWACVAVIALGFAFAWWARVHLGALWSGWVVAKADHRVVDTGPPHLYWHSHRRLRDDGR
jgi:protein-S-isoprenylcysteine O-methyltransferase Ste14